MGLREQCGLIGRITDAGYAMAGLLVSIAIMGIVMSMIMPTWRTWAKREKEAELIFRGEQYMRAIELYQRQFVGAYPTDMDLLVEQRFLRRAYTDPMTGAEFEVLTQGSVQGASGEQLAATSGQAGVVQQQPSASLSRVNQDASGGSSSSRLSTAAAEFNEGAGGIIGVVSRSTATSMALYNEADRYDEWLFVYLPQATQPGLGTGVPGGQGVGVQPGIGGGLGGNGQGAQQSFGGARGGQRPGDAGRQPGVNAPGGNSPGAGRQRPNGGGATLGSSPRR